MAFKIIYCFTVSLSVSAAQITSQDRSMWRMLWPSAGQAQQWVSLLLSVPTFKRFSAKKFLSPTKMGPKNGSFRENRGLNVRFYFQNPQKAHPCVEPHLLTYFAWRSVWGLTVGASSVGERKNQKNILGVIFHPYGEKKPWSDLHKILHWEISRI